LVKTDDKRRNRKGNDAFLEYFVDDIDPWFLGFHFINIRIPDKRIAMLSSYCRLHKDPVFM